MVFITDAHAQYSEQAEQFTNRADSAIEAGDLALAEDYTIKAIELAKKGRNDALEAKILVNLISIKIERENNVNIDEWYDRAYKVVVGLNDDVELANLLNIKARHLMYNQKFVEAREYYARVGDVYKHMGNKPIVAYYYNDLGYLEEAEGNPEKAADWYLKSVHIFEQSTDSSGLANTLGNLANAYYSLDEKEKAISYAQQSVAIRKRTGDKEGIAIVLGNITRIYLSMEKMDSARYYQREYINYASRSGKKKTLADSYVNLSMMHHAGKRYGEAVSAIKNAIVVAKDINHPNLANFYRMCALFLGKMDNVQEMNLYYDSCFTLLGQNNNNTQYRDYYATRMNYFKSKGDYKNAFENYEQYIAYKDAVLNEEVKKQVAQYEIQYETQKKNAQIATERNEKIQQQLYYNIALALLVVGLLVGLVLFNRYRFRKKLEQKNLLLSERNRISTELHDEVGSSLSAIHLMSFAAMAQSEQAAPQLHGNLKKINTNTKSMMESISDIVWSMNPDNDQLSRIVARMKTFATEILEATDTDFEMKTDESLADIRLSPEKSRDIYLVFKEAVNNASKYAQAAKVSVKLWKMEQILVLEITDDGSGFDAVTVANGNGLRNMRQRVERHGGSFELRTQQGNGTKLLMTLPYAS